LIQPIESKLHESIDSLRISLASVIRGKQRVIDHLILALLAEGSVLLEDVPGVGKTTLAKTLAACVGLDFKRIQCTPDLLPADIVGFSMYQPSSGTFEFRPGPVFANLLVVDEINRASPRTQSALLEAMAERQVTVDGIRRPLSQPFLVIATQNPLGYAGTFPLPESQLDRFLFQLSMDYPDPDSEAQMLIEQAASHPTENVEVVLGLADVLEAQRLVRNIRVERPVADYIVDLVRHTRSDQRLVLGASPRGSQMLLRAAQAHAFVDRRDYVLPDDVQAVAALSLAHRVVAMDGDGFDMGVARGVIRDIVSAVEVRT
jgi:MoxR-like ATPase